MARAFWKYARAIDTKIYLTLKV